MTGETFLAYNTVVVLAGVGLLGAAAGLVGTFATLRRRALVGDALAHAALPGLCLAFLVIGERWLPGLLVGALLSGLVGVGVIAFLRRFTRIKDDAAIGIVLSVFFGLGIALSVRIQQTPGIGNKAGLDSYILGKTAGMILADVQLIALVAVLALVLLLLFYKEAKLVVFDADFARVQGWPTGLLDFLLMGLLAVVVVIGLPAVGVVLMAALLILPGSTARFWSDRFGVILTLATLFGAVTGLLGAALSAATAMLPAGPIIVLVGTAFFLVSALLAPRRGLIARFVQRWHFRRELDRRTLLRLLYDRTETRLPTVEAVPEAELLRARSWSRSRLHCLYRWGVTAGLLVPRADHAFEPTRAGVETAAAIVREYRLWELFLSEYPDQASAAGNLLADPVDALLPANLVAELERRLRQAGRDPNARQREASS